MKNDKRVCEIAIKMRLKMLKYKIEILIVIYEDGRLALGALFMVYYAMM